MTEKIVTERLYLRRFMANDWRDLFEYLSDPEVVKYEPYDVFSVEEAQESAIKKAINDSFFAVCLKVTHKLIGHIYFEKGDFDTWELGYVFNRNYWGKGYASESIAALIDYAITHWNARRIIACCSTENARSWRLLERLHFRKEGTLIENIAFKNDASGNRIWFDSFEYAILKQEWLKFHPKKTAK